MARRLGVTVSYDTNLRLNLWPVEEARAALEDILPHVDIVFVSHPSETEYVCSGSTRSWPRSSFFSTAASVSPP